MTNRRAQRLLKFDSFKSFYMPHGTQPAFKLSFPTISLSDARYQPRVVKYYVLFTYFVFLLTEPLSFIRFRLLCFWYQVRTHYSIALHWVLTKLRCFLRGAKVLRRSVLTHVLCTGLCTLRVLLTRTC